jgi:two-component system, response regulator PdtaR
MERRALLREAEAPLVLIAEDEFAIALAVQTMLRDLGLRTTEPVSRGADAVRLALSVKPDLLVMDVRLLDAIDGVEAARRITAHHAVPVIFLTAYSDPQMRARIGEIPGSSLLVKPTIPYRLKAAVEHSLGRSLDA